MDFKLLIIFHLSLLTACQFINEDNPNALKEPFLYENDEVGWKIEIPAGWEIIAEEELHGYDEKGEELMESVLETEIEYSNLINMIGFKKDDANIFTSTAEPFFEEYIGEWKKNNEFIKEVLLITYQENGLIPEITPSSTKEIGGIQFETYFIYLYDETNKNILNQVIFSSFHNEYDIGMSITYTDEDLKDEMLEIIYSSTFETKERPDSVKQRYAQMNSIYQDFIEKGDEAFANEKYGEAMYWYDKASIKNVLDSYPQTQLSLCKEKAGEESYRELEIEENYQKVLTKANEYFSSGNYEKAKAFYERAGSLRPSDSYPKDKIIEIEKLTQ